MMEGNFLNPNKGEKESEIEGRNEIISVALESLVNKGEKINEGNNGIILKINIEECLKIRKFIEFLEENGLSVDKENVLKILKIYSPGVAQREADMQKMAEKIVNKAVQKNENANLAQVPQVGKKSIEFKELGDITIGKLEASGVKVNDSRAEAIMMEYIPGVDIATMLYREVVKRHEKLVHLRDDLENIRFSQLQDEVARVLFYEPRSNSKDQFQREADKEKVMRENVEALYAFLQKSGFVMDAKIIDKLENTIKLFHKSGLYLMDAHLRNFLVVGNDAFVIDFGDAKIFEGEYDPKNYIDEGNKTRHVNPLNTLGGLRSLTLSKDSRIIQEATEMAREILRFREKSPKFKIFREKFILTLNESLSQEDLRVLFYEKTRNYTEIGDSTKLFLAVTLRELLDKKIINRGNLIGILEDKRFNSLDIPSQNYLRRFIASV